MRFVKKEALLLCISCLFAGCFAVKAAETESTEKQSEHVPSALQMVDGIENETGWNGITIGIDAGHQGYWIDMSEQEPVGPGSSETKKKCTTGTQGTTTGVPEYKLNLDISLKLQDELLKRGYHVVMPRTDHDTSISNSERALMAAENGSDIYVRIHANGSDDVSDHGALAMIMSPDNHYVADIYEESSILAKDILDDYCSAAGFENLGVQFYDNMTGINWSKVPVMILEMGYMTNREDDIAMQLESTQEKMVCGIADGIDRYFTDNGKLVNAEADPALQNAVSETDEDENTEGLIGDSPDQKNDAMKKLYEEYLRDEEARGAKWSVSMQDLTSDKVVSWNEDRIMQSASVIKVFIMGAVYDRICYPNSNDKAISYTESYSGELRSLLEQMITVSSNEAANRCIEILGEGDFTAGSKVVNEFCRQNGYIHTSVGRRFLESNPTGDNYTSASDCRKILADIYHGKCVNQEADAKMLGILKNQTVKYKIPAGLPSGYSSANKTGEMPEGYNLGCIENDIAIIFSPLGDYVLTVLSNDLGGRNSEADDKIARISSYVAAHQKELFS